MKNTLPHWLKKLLYFSFISLFFAIGCAPTTINNSREFKKVLLTNEKFSSVDINDIKIVKNRLEIHTKYLELAIFKANFDFEDNEILFEAANLGANYVLIEGDNLILLRTKDLPVKDVIKIKNSDS